MNTTQSIDRAGFTLLELLVVIAIMGLLAIAVPRALPAGGARLRSETTQLLANLQLARNDAIRTGHPVFLRFDRTPNAMTPDSYRRVLPPPVRLSMERTDSGLLGLESDRIGFFPDGSATGATLILRNGQAVKKIDIDALNGQATAHD